MSRSTISATRGRGGAALAQAQRKARRLAASGDLDAAIILLRAAVQRAEGPNQCSRAALASALVNLSACCVAAGLIEEGVRHLRRAMRLDRRSAEAYCALARICEKQGLPELALELLREAVRLSPRSLEYRLALARNLAERGRPRQAAQCLRGAIRLFPDSVEARCALAELCIDLGDHRRAIEQAHHIRNRSPRNPGAYELLAVAYFQTGRIAEAIDAVRSLIRLEPNEAHHHLKLGTLLRHQGAIADAMREFGRATAIARAQGDRDTEQVAQRAVADLDDLQLQQILLRAAEDRLFRLRVAHDPVNALLRHGFQLSEDGFNALTALDLTGGENDQAPPHVYH